MRGGYTELSELRDRVGGRPRSTNLRVWRVPGGALDRTLRFEWRGRRCTSYTNGSWLHLEVQVETALCFSAIQPDAVMGLTSDLGQVAGTRVFVHGTGRDSEAFRDWAGVAANSRLLQRLPLSEDEALLVARNGLSATLRPVGVERHLRLLDALVDLAEALPAEREPDPEPVLPEGLERLQPLVGRWAVDDDEERAELIERASTEELQSLVSQVEPYLGAVDLLFAEDETGAATGVSGRLAEAAIEARAELERRRD